MTTATSSVRPIRRLRVEDVFSTLAYSGASFSHDGAQLLLSGDPTGVQNVHTVPVTGGALHALTASITDATYAVSFFRTDDRVLFTHDRGGDERHHLYVRELDGRVHDLTPGEALKAGFAGWSRAGDRFYVTTNARDPRAFDVYEYATDGYARTLLFRNDGGFLPARVAPDGRHVALERPRGASDRDVFLFDRTTGRTEQLTPHAGAWAVAAFAADSGALYLTTDAGSEFRRLDRLDLRTRERTTVLAPAWDVVFAEVAPDGGTLAVGVNVDARVEVELYALPSMHRLPTPAVPGASVSSVVFSPNGRRVAFYASASRVPNDLYVADVPTVGGGVVAPPRRLTHSLGAGGDAPVDAAALVDGRVVRFASYDGLEVPGVLYLPNSAIADAPVPAVVMVHGGPGGQARIGWHPVAQLLVNHGYAVFDVNNRGSSGYGRTFYDLDVRQHGEADLGDVIAARTLLAGTGVVNLARIAVMGASYGGFLVLAALTQHPAAFAAGVDLFGPSDWVRTLESLPVWLGAQRDALIAKMGDPVADAERLRRVSPIFHAERIRRPLLVLQGANDPRVLPRESEEIVAAVRRNGVPVEYVVFPDEGHGFVRRTNQVRGYGAVLAFLDRYVGVDRGAGSRATIGGEGADRHEHC